MRRILQEGVIQVASGIRYQEEAVSSVERIRPFLNGRPITLFTDKPETVPSGLLTTLWFIHSAH